MEVRRIGEIIKGEPSEEYQADEDEGVEFVMIDEPDQPPWVAFQFDINVKESLAVPAEGQKKRGRPRKILDAGEF